jgi:long-subunit acyl-CoA synthetase (AMP-forming)
MSSQIDAITLSPSATLSELLRERLARTPDTIAYRQYAEEQDDWLPWTWREFADYVCRWQAAFTDAGLQPGDRIALMVKNSREWAAFDIAAQGLGLVVVPLYVNDRPDNLGLILEDCGAKLLLVGQAEQWDTLGPIEKTLGGLETVLTLEPVKPLPRGLQAVCADDWLPQSAGELRVEAGDAKVQEFLSQQPTLVRKLLTDANKVGWEHFLYIQGRGQWSLRLEIWKQLDDLVGPKIRYKLGGRLRCAVAGGAAMAPEVAQFFIGAGIPVLQGYGATETSPVVAVNTLESNKPDSVGRPLRGVEVKLGEMDEMLTRSPSVMLGYWNNPEATAKSIDSEGWFHTGDRVRIDEEGHVYIIGRIKEIIVLANGEKVPPGDMEQAIGMDPLFGQVLVIGEAKPYLTALVVLSPAEYQKLADTERLSSLAAEKDGERLEQILVKRISDKLKDFPGYAKIPRVAVVDKPWTIESGMMTPTLKLKRGKILDTHSADVARLYAGH